MFRKTLYFIVIFAFMFVAVALLLPKTVHVERSVVIDRPPTTLFTVLNSFRAFSAWSPLSERDPDIVYEYSGPVSGKGARISWSGDSRQVGRGFQEIIASKPWSIVRMQIEFEHQGRAETSFLIDPIGPGVTVTWGFEASLVEGQGFFGSLLARYFGLFFDSWIGTDYENGLARLKTFAESLPAADFSDLEVDVVEVEALDILYIATDSRQSRGNASSQLAGAYREISAFMAEHSIEMQAQPMTITRSWDARDYKIDAAIPISVTEVEMSGNVRMGKSPDGRAVRVVHRGPSERMAPSYAKLAAYMAANGLKQGSVSWEQYISDPAHTPVEETISHIYFLIEDDR
jgi:effector-binding domain-containing protein